MSNQPISAWSRVADAFRDIRKLLRDGWTDGASRAVLLACAAIAGHTWSGEASAVITGCELQASGATNTSAISGASATLNFKVVDTGGCTGTNRPEITVSILAGDSTGGASLTSTTSFTDTATGVDIPVTVLLGPNDGSATVEVSCGAFLCDLGSPLTLTFATANVYTLERVIPASGMATAQPGDTVTLEFQALRNGTEPVGTTVSFDSPPSSTPLDASPPVLGSANTNASTGIGSVSFSHSPSVTTQYTFTARYCDPSQGCDADVTQTFVVNIGEWQLTSFAGTAQTPLTNEVMSPLVVQLIDANADPVSGQLVNFSVDLAGVTLSALSDTTDANGRVETTATTGTTTGTLNISSELASDPTVNHFATYTVSDDYDLSANSPTTITVGTGETASMSVLYKISGSASTLGVNWVDPGGGTLGSGFYDSGTGEGSNGFSSTTPGSYSIVVNAVCPTSPVEPDCPLASPPSVTFTVNVVDRQLTVTGGDSQNGPADQTLPLPLEVLVADFDGSTSTPVSGATVNFEVVSGNATLSASSDTSDGTGHASVNLTFGSAPDTSVTVKAYRADNPSLQRFFFLSIDAEYSFSAASPISETISVGATATLQTLYTINRTPSTDNIGWVITSGSGGTLAGGSAVAGNASGISSNGFSASAAGVFTITATPECPLIIASAGGAKSLSTTCASITPVVFTVTVSDRVLLGGGNAEGAPGQSFLLTVRAEDNGNPASGVTVNWSKSGTGSLSGTSSTSDASGDATITATLGGAVGDSMTVTASRADDPAASVSFTLTAVAPQLSIVAGNGQSGAIGATAPVDLEVELRDGTSSNLPVNAGTIVWTVMSGPATLSAGSATTDANGHAKVTANFGTTPGSSVIRAADSNGLASVLFNLTSTDDPVLTAVQGSGQSGVAGSTGDLPLRVRLTDALGAALNGEIIAWTVSAGDISLQASTSTTDATGHAEMPFAFGSTLGPATVTATARGSLTAQFSLEVIGGSTVPVPGSNNQSCEVGKPCPNPLTIRVTSGSTAGSGAGSIASFGAGHVLGLAGVPVTWVVTEGGGSVSESNTVTDANGESSVIFTMGPEPGTHSVTATTPSSTTVFTMSAYVPTGVLVKISGDNQTLPTNTESQPLVVELRSEAGTPLSGVTLNWVGENAELDESSTVTDANGRASVIATVVEPGAASVSVSSENPDAGPVSFSLNGGIANLPGLSEELEQVAEVIDELCPALAAIENRTPEQEDLLLRCRELVDATGIDPDATIDALEELFADLAVAQTNSSLLSLQSQFQNLKARIAALRSGAMGGNFGGLSLMGPGGMVSLGGLFTAFAGEEGKEIGGDFSRWGWFMSGTIGRGESDATSLNPAYDFDINGLTAGIDYRYNDKLIIGGSIGYTRQDTEAANDAGTLDTSGWSLSAYGTWYQESSWYFDGVLTLGRNSYDSERPIQYTLPLVGGGEITVDQIAKASSDGNLMQGAFTFGRDFQKGGWNFGAYSRLLYSSVDFGASEEVLQAGPGAGLGLAVRERSEKSLATVLGGKASFAHSAAWGILMPHIELEWERETNDDAPVIEAYFLHDPTQSPIRIVGERSDRSYFRLGLGLSMVLASGRSGFVYYERLMGRSGMSQDNLSLGFRMEF